MTAENSWAIPPDPDPDDLLSAQRAEVEAMEAALADRLQALATPTATRPPVNVNLQGLAFDILVDLVCPPGSAASLAFRRQVAERASAFLDDVERQVAEQEQASRLLVPGGPQTVPGRPPGVSPLRVI